VVFSPYNHRFLFLILLHAAMYRPLLNRQTRRVLNGYVCRQCQQQLAQQRVTQYLRESSSQANAANGAEPDGPDWVENFNSLSDFHCSQDPAQIDQKKKPGHRKGDDREAKAGEDNGENVNQRRRRNADYAQRKRERKRNKMQADLMTRLDEASKTPPNAREKKNRIEAEGPEKKRFGEDQTDQRSTFEALMKSLAQDATARIQEQVHGNISTDASNPRSEEIAINDDSDLPVGGASDRQASKASPSADGEQAGLKIEKLSSPSARKTTVTASAGIPSKQQKSTASQHIAPDDTKLTYSPSALPRTYKFGRTRLMPLAARYEETMNRPQWGGLDEQSSSSIVKASHEDLRKERRSLQEASSRNVHARDCGLDPHDKTRTIAEPSLAEDEGAQVTVASDVADRTMPKRFESTTRSIARTFSYLKEAFRMNLERGARPDVPGAEKENGERPDIELPQEKSRLGTAEDSRSEQRDAANKSTARDAQQKEHGPKEEIGVRQGQALHIEQNLTAAEKLTPEATDGKASDSTCEVNKTVKTGPKNTKKKKKKDKTEGTSNKKSRRRNRRRLDPTQPVRKVQSTQSRFRKLLVHDEPVSEGGISSTEGRKQQSVSINEDSALSTSSTTAELGTNSSSGCVPRISSREVNRVFAGALEVNALNVEQPPVPPLQYGLDRVLFNPGVYQLQDPHSRVYNFDPFLQKLMPIPHFDFNLLKAYKTSSQDVMLSTLAKQHNKKYVGSTSSMTGTLAHFHYLLSNWRLLNVSILSKGFEETNDNFTAINRSPNAIFLRYKGDGIYAIDADKEYDGANVLMMLGKSMEKLLTLPREEYERYKKDSENKITEQEQDVPESFEFTTFGDFLMRSQLDAYDPRLPGSGMFDLKTRAVVSIRMNVSQPEPMLGYEIHNLRGTFESYEREYYDMMRSTMLKYSLQARMGRMDGIFVAYHNIQRIFGFQYMPISEMDLAIHGQSDRCLGDQEFRVSLKLLNEVFEMATQRFPGQTLRFHFETMMRPTTLMWIFAEPMEDKEVEKIQAASKEKVAEFERDVMGIQHPSTNQTDSIETLEASEKVSQNLGSAGTPDTAASNGGEDYASSTTSADPAFLSELTSSPSTDHSLSGDGKYKYKPIFAATLIAKSFVNGTACKMDRPSHLLPTDKWNVEYILKEAVLPDAEKWARYTACKDRRKKNFEKFEDEGEIGDGEEAGRGKRESVYLRRLREMSEQGRKFRKGVEEKEEGMEKVVVGLPVTTSGGNGEN